MCGIAGLTPIDAAGSGLARLQAMCAALTHRGPDGGGLAVGSPAAVASGPLPNVASFQARVAVGLGSTRLSVIDPSPRGGQPMCSDDRRTWIVYNGEVYNFQALRRELEAAGRTFRSRTDTEVVLALYEAEGPDGFRRLSGMFALAIWDGARDELILARDRFGIKPLYYAALPGGFAFASELKALFAAGIQPSLSVEQLQRYLTFLWVPDPATILDGVHKVPAGHWMRIRPGADPVTHPFWVPDWAARPPEPCTEAAAAEELLARLSAAVRRQTVADVPVGAFLSGGLDSSAVVALMARTGRPPARVYSAGFTRRDQRYEGVPDDLRYARRLAEHLALPHEEIVLQPRVADLLPKLVWSLDEPMADPAAIPAYLICQAAKPHTTVLLSGMGADEIFGGYRRHLTECLLGIHAGLPAPARWLLAAGARALPSGGRLPFVASVRHARKLLRLAPFPAGERYIQACAWMDAATRDRLCSPALREGPCGAEPEALHREALATVASADPLTQMLALDTRLYLPSHNLNYTDRMSMAASVEVRVPFLDNDVVDFAFALPSSLKVRGLTGKYVLRRALATVLPREILGRRKTGFSAPIRGWLGNELREMVHDLLSPARVRRRGLFDADEVTRLVDEQDRGREDRSHQIWALLTLELWLQAYRGGGAA